MDEDRAMQTGSWAGGIKRLAATSALALGVAVASLITPMGAGEAHAATKLGDVNLRAYCKHVYGPEAIVVLAPFEVKADAYGWRCFVARLGPTTPGSPAFTHISINDACKWQYRKPTAFARYRSFSDAYSWECWLP